LWLPKPYAKSGRFIANHKIRSIRCARYPYRIDI
jgi:hypothetical protein